MTTNKKCICDNCGTIFDNIGMLSPIPEHGLLERLDPGAEVPAGECPGCGAFAYLADAEDKPLWAIINREKLLQDLAAGLLELEHPVTSYRAGRQIALVGISITLYGCVVNGEEGENYTLLGCIGTFLDYLANDIYCNEEADWSKATGLTVGTY